MLQAIIAVVIAVVLGGIYALGDHNGFQRRDLTAKQAELAQVARDLRGAQAVGVSSAQVGAETQAADTQIRWRTRTLIERIPKYVTPAADAACVVPDGFVRLHDAAAQDVDPGPPAATDLAASGIALSQVARVDAANLGIAHLYANRVHGLEAWICATRAALDQAPDPTLNCQGSGTFDGEPVF